MIRLILLVEDADQILLMRAEVRPYGRVPVAPERIELTSAPPVVYGVVRDVYWGMDAPVLRVTPQPDYPAVKERLLSAGFTPVRNPPGAGDSIERLLVGIDFSPLEDTHRDPD